MPKTIIFVNASEEEKRSVLLAEGRKLKERMEQRDIEQDVADWIKGLEEQEGSDV